MNQKDNTYRVILKARKPPKNMDEWLTKTAAATDCNTIEVFLLINRCLDNPDNSEYVCEQATKGKTFIYVTNPLYAKRFRDYILVNFADDIIKDPVSTEP
jgi:hypothetical protein